MIDIIDLSAAMERGRECFSIVHAAMTGHERTWPHISQLGQRLRSPRQESGNMRQIEVFLAAIWATTL
jgi:hypothetical protein